jgi:hypothetical protein
MSVGINDRSTDERTKTESKPSNKHMPPSISKALPETSQSREQAGDKNGSASAKPLVKR